MTFAIDWIRFASSREIIAFGLFKAEGCPSCGHNVAHWCACWKSRQPQYLEQATKAEEFIQNAKS